MNQMVFAVGPKDKRKCERNGGYKLIFKSLLGGLFKRCYREMEIADAAKKAICVIF